MIGSFDTWTIALGAVLAFVTATIHGATGVAGGWLLTAALAPVIGVAPIVPVISVALLISHASRATMNFAHFDRTAFLSICLPAVPCIAIMAFVYGRMSSSLIAVVLGTVILVAVPLRHWTEARQIRASQRTLVGVGAVYGTLSGVSIGPGMLLVPFMLGYGLSRQAFVATLAGIALIANLTRTTVFGSTDLLTWDLFLYGAFIGLMTIPGNWFGRIALRRMTNKHHGRLVDGLTIVGALNFYWLALNSG